MSGSVAAAVCNRRYIKRFQRWSLPELVEGSEISPCVSCAPTPRHPGQGVTPLTVTVTPCGDGPLVVLPHWWCCPLCSLSLSQAHSSVRFLNRCFCQGGPPPRHPGQGIAPLDPARGRW
ncbi:MAG: hypothetical protein AAGF95_34585 [Chloroflexota bacterium]